MAVTSINRHQRFQCSSTDIKPTGAEIKVGAEIFETNTGATFRYDGTAWKKIRSAAIDNATYARNTIDYEHHEIHAGSHYFVSSFVDIPGANDVLDFTWQMPNTAKWIHWTWDIFTEKAGTWYVYEGTSTMATNPLANTITPLNSDRNSTGASGTTLKYEIQADLAAANADTNVAGGTLLKSGKLGDNRAGGYAERRNEVILDQNSLYCLRFAASAAGYLNFNMHWYEHTNKE